jgi:hypothetical protein
LTIWDVSLLCCPMAGFEAHAVCFQHPDCNSTAKLAQDTTKLAETLDAALPRRPHEATINFADRGRLIAAHFANAYKRDSRHAQPST